ncbi:UNVERIFIED_CONTAM: hypothetical protein NCL1_44963 [Trichonephila clavipes]
MSDISRKLASASDIRATRFHLSQVESHKQDSSPVPIENPIGLTCEHNILVLKPSPCLHNGSQVDNWMGLNEWNSWFKSQVRDSNRCQDIVDLNKLKICVRNSPMSMKL